MTLGFVSQGRMPECNSKSHENVAYERIWDRLCATSAASGVVHVRVKMLGSTRVPIDHSQI